MTSKLSCTILAMTASLATFAPALGANEVVVEPPQEVERWFAALGGVNHRDFGELIADDAIFVLKDLGVEQTKQEFISSLVEWDRATKNANIVYRYETIEDGKASALVCYHFKSNEQLNLESFTYSGGQITGSVHEYKGEDCGDL